MSGPAEQKIADIKRLMDSLVRNDNARLATVIVTFRDGRQVEITTDSSVGGHA